MDVRQMPVADLSSLCQEETAKYLRQEASLEVFCFELFRRAFADRNNVAWEAIQTRYHRFVLTWVRHHPARSSVNEDHEHWVHEAYTRYWISLHAKPFDSFRNLAALLGFLKTCVHSTLMDAVRRHSTRREVGLDQLIDSERQADDETPGDSITSAELWRIVAQELQNEAERLVVYNSFVLDMKPSEIQAAYPEQYPNVDDVYRIKRNVLDRLRRNPRLRPFLD